MRLILNHGENDFQIGPAATYDRAVLVLTRFRVPPESAAQFRADLAAALQVLEQQPGFGEGVVGRNVDDPTLWVLETRWEGPGAYRRALSAYDVKMHAWELLGRALEEPTAYEVVRPGQALNEARPRGHQGPDGL
jgi:quinol monooxygenase YgiN